MSAEDYETRYKGQNVSVQHDALISIRPLSGTSSFFSNDSAVHEIFVYNGDRKSHFFFLGGGIKIW